MIVVLLLGFLTTLACLALQAVTLAFAVRYFARAEREPLETKSRWTIFLHLSALMGVLMLGNVVQTGLWAALYRMAGALPDFETALYFSGVTFTTLGYGDVVLSGRARLLAPMQAANGLMMFGITTAAFITALQKRAAQRSATAKS